MPPFETEENAKLAAGLQAIQMSIGCPHCTKNVKLSVIVHHPDDEELNQVKNVKSSNIEYFNLSGEVRSENIPEMPGTESNIIRIKEEPIEAIETQEKEAPHLFIEKLQSSSMIASASDNQFALKNLNSSENSQLLDAPVVGKKRTMPFSETYCKLSKRTETETDIGDIISPLASSSFQMEVVENIEGENVEASSSMLVSFNQNSLNTETEFAVESKKPSASPKERSRHTEINTSSESSQAILENIKFLEKEAPPIVIDREEIRQASKIYPNLTLDSKLYNYRNRLNEVAFEICMKHPLLIKRKGELKKLAEEKIRIDGYNYKRGKSRSNEVTQAETTKRITNNERDRKLRETMVDIQDIDDRLLILTNQRDVFLQNKEYLAADQMYGAMEELKIKKRSLLDIYRDLENRKKKASRQKLFRQINKVCSSDISAKGSLVPSEAASFSEDCSAENVFDFDAFRHLAKQSDNTGETEQILNDDCDSKFVDHDQQNA